MSKNTKIAIVIVAGLIVLFGVILTVLLLNNREDRALYTDEKIRIRTSQEVLGEYNLDELLQMSPETEFDAIYKPNNMPPIEKTYTGIYLLDLLDSLNIDIESVQSIKFKAMDGYEMIYSIEDILIEDNVYIAYLSEGQPFAEGIESNPYPDEDGGPFVVIRAKDQTSQYRVKLLVEITVELED
ncbi:MAG: hypothetical protein ACOCWI_03405 [Bacillota bacterium]